MEKMPQVELQTEIDPQERVPGSGGITDSLLLSRRNFLPTALGLAGCMYQWCRTVAEEPESRPEQTPLLQTPESPEVPESEAPRLPYEPTSHYQVRELRGWQVLVHRTLTEEHEDLCHNVLELVDFQLYQITRAVPAPAVEKLRRIRIWVEYADPRHPCACYHVSRGWLRAHGFNPEKAGSVEIANSRRFLQWTHDQPWMLLHELAHGYHHQFLGGYENPEIAAVWKAAVEEGLYDEVLYCHGIRKPAYAKNNPQEYFAELSEAWFGVNDFFPFVRAEVLAHDPRGAELLRRLWGR
jgi:hypothetical protein